ncbi:MAG: response regulator [Acidobacteriota bacterium]
MDWSTKSILVVDDERLFVSSVQDAIKDRFPGIQCLTAGDGQQALKHIDSIQPDVVLTDLSMPVMDGFQLLAELSARRFRSPILVATAFATPESEEIVRRFGALEILEKPVDIGEMLDRMAELAVHPRVEVGLLSPAGFSRLMAREQRSGILTTVNGDLRGELVFDHGDLIDAVAGEQVGDAAALEIFSWASAKLELREIPPKCRHRVESFLDDLLLGTAPTPRRSDIASKSMAEEDEWSDAFDQQFLLKQPTSKPKEKAMGNVNESLDSAMEIDGALVTALVDFESGMTLGTRGDAFNIELAASGNTEVVLSKMKVMQSLGLEGGIEDILITLSDQYHLIRPLTKERNLFLYLAIDRKKGNLGMARHKLSSIENELAL